MNIQRSIQLGLVAFALFATSCDLFDATSSGTANDSTSNTEESSTEQSNTDEAVLYGAKVIAESSALPICDSSTLGQLYFIELQNEFQTCTSNGYSVIILMGSQGEKGEAGSNGTSGKDGVDGEAGRDGENGLDGTDGLNGESCLANPILGGVEISCSGLVVDTIKDGRDGENGIDGIDGVDGVDGRDGRDSRDGTSTGVPELFISNDIAFESLPLYMQIAGIPGSVTEAGLEESIKVSQLYHRTAKTPSSKERELGLEDKGYFEIYKSIDKSSPLLIQAADEVDVIRDMTFIFFEDDSLGRQFYTITLQNCLILEVETFMGSVNSITQEAYQERVIIYYETVTWTFLDGNLQHSTTQPQLFSNSTAPVYMNIVGIPGSVEKAGFEDAIAIYKFDHTIYIPIDPDNGTTSGTRKHGAIEFHKVMDKSSSLLIQKLTTGEIIGEMMFKVLNSDLTGEHIAYEITLENCKIITVETYLDPESAISDNELLERIEVHYETITWNYLDGNLQHTDQWAER